jgi:hypothetical protein
VSRNSSAPVARGRSTGPICWHGTNRSTSMMVTTRLRRDHRRTVRAHHQQGSPINLSALHQRPSVGRLPLLRPLRFHARPVSPLGTSPNSHMVKVSAPPTHSPQPSPSSTRSSRLRFRAPTTTWVVTSLGPVSRHPSAWSPTAPDSSPSYRDCLTPRHCPHPPRTAPLIQRRCQTVLGTHVPGRVDTGRRILA